MAKVKKTPRPKAETPKGFRDYFGDDVVRRKAMLDRIAEVYHAHGFDALESSAVETVEALGKFLPDVDRPNEGVFAWQEDEDAAWVALRYDLTAPLARVYAQHRNDLPTPYRRYAMGPVWRNEKPGPGRFRQFYQCDADTVGTASVAADAEICMMLADALEAVGIERGDYVIRVNNRKVLNGVLEVAGLPETAEKTPLIMNFAINNQRRVHQITLQGHLDRSEIDQLTDMLKSVASVESDSNKDQNDFIRKVHDELTGAGSNPGFHLAQLNIAKFREPAMNTINNDFHAAIESVNKYAEAEPGFVWRLVDDGPEREGIPLFEDPDMLVNLTVWSDPESLMKFVYRTPIHRDIMRRREEWFDHMEFSMVLWWVKDGDRPSLKEAAEKLDLLAAKGATEDAFTFKERFPPPVQSTTSD